MDRQIMSECCRQWCIPSCSGAEKSVLADVRTLAQQSGYSLARTEDMLSALAEACLNAAEHGNGMNPALNIRIEYQFEDRTTLLRIYDEGTGFDVDELVASEQAERGWGLMLMRELSDRVCFFQDTCGQCAELVFYLDQKGDGNHA